MIARAFESINAIAKEIREVIGGVEELNSFITLPNVDGFRRSTNAPRAIFDKEALIDLFNYTWFSRVWVVQEATLAPRSKLFCGQLEIELDHVLNAAVWLGQYHFYQIPIDLSSSKGLRNAADLWDHISYANAGKPLLLKGFLISSRRLECHDPRDRVFAMLGMTIYRNDIPRLLLPSYTKSYPQVIRDAVRHCLQRDLGGLGLLGLVGHRNDSEFEDTEYPSWVPRLERRWDGKFDASELARYGPSHESGPSYVANADNDADVLSLRGYVIDELAQVSEVFPADWSTYMELHGHISHMVDVGRNYGQSEDDIARALVADRIANQKSDVESRTGLSAFLTRLRERKDSNISDIGPDTDQSYKRAAYFWPAMQSTINRRFAVTKGGRAGIVPKICGVGDVVAIVRNAASPFVLERSSNGYRFVGPCYFNGCMHEAELEKIFTDYSEEILNIR